MLDSPRHHDLERRHVLQVFATWKIGESAGSSATATPVLAWKNSSLTAVRLLLDSAVLLAEKGMRSIGPNKSIDHSLEPWTNHLASLHIVALTKVKPGQLLEVNVAIYLRHSEWLVDQLTKGEQPYTMKWKQDPVSTYRYRDCTSSMRRSGFSNLSELLDERMSNFSHPSVFLSEISPSAMSPVQRALAGWPTAKPGILS